MEGILGLVGNVWTMVGDALTFMKSEPITLLPVAIGAVGATVGLTKRIIRFGGRRR